MHRIHHPVRLLCAAVLLFSTLAQCFDPNLERVLNLQMAINSGSQIIYSNPQVIDFILQADPPFTAVIPLVFDVHPDNLDQYADIFTNLSAHGIPIYPTMGNHKQENAMDCVLYRQIAAAYRKYSSCIQVGDVQTYYQRNKTDVEAYIAHLIDDLKFEHIQLNAWPQDWVPKWPQVDSAFQNVEYNPSSPDDPTNWTPKGTRIQELIAAMPTLRVLLNYEDPPGQVPLAALGSPASQISIFQRTVRYIHDTYNPSEHVYWTAPWSVNYEPPQAGTWKWILQYYEEFATNSSAIPAYTPTPTATQYPTSTATATSTSKPTSAACGKHNQAVVRPLLLVGLLLLVDILT